MQNPLNEGCLAAAIVTRLGDGVAATGGSVLKVKLDAR